MNRSPDERTAADVVIAVLRANAVSTIFALPGEENLPLVSAIRRADLPLVVCRHEQHAGFMAVAHARLTGELAVCLATLGPGALNLLTSLAQAHLLQVPVLALTGQKPQRDNDEGSFQVLDVVGAARPIVGSALTARDPQRIGSLLSDAVSRAMSAPQGAVLVELPEDIAAAPVTTPTYQAEPLAVPSATAAPAALNGLLARIDRSARPVVLAGSRSTERAAAAALQRLAAVSGLSVLATQMGKGAISELDSRSLRSLGIHRRDHAHLALDEADLVITVGYQPVEHPPLAWQPDRRLPIVHLDDAPSRREAGYEPELDVVGDIAVTLERLASSSLRVASDWSDRARAEINARLDAEEGPSAALDPLDVVRTVAAAHEPGDVVALDNGAFKIWFARHFPSPEPLSCIMDNATATMGAGLATATEAARLGRRALAVVGDGGLMMNVGDLETAVRLGVDLTVLVLRDDAYGFIAWHQDEQGRARHGVTLTNPDLTRLAEAFGGTGRTVDTAAGLVAALDESRRLGGLVVIDCEIDYSINEML